MLIGRLVSHIDNKLIGSLVSVTGNVKIIKNNPFKGEKMILLSPVIIAGKLYDHVWIFSCYDTKDVIVGDVVDFQSKLSTYIHNCQKKWRLSFPFYNFKSLY